jgi:hypothetical protein
LDDLVEGHWRELPLNYFEFQSAPKGSTPV